MATAAWRTLGKCRILMNATAETTAKKPSGFMIPKPISPRLQDFMGYGPEAARTEVWKKLWGHIKLHNLQNPTYKRQIICDEKLKTLFGKDKFVITEIPGLLNKHFIKKV